MAVDRRRYTQIVVFRVVIAVLALLTAARAGHEFRDNGSVWLTTSILAAGASATLIWPLIVPSQSRTMSVYSFGPAFFLAAMFLLPPAALVLATAFAVTLAGLMSGARPYRTLYNASVAILAFGGFALYFDLGPRPSDYLVAPAARVGLELMIAAAAMVTMLLIRSIAMRIEQGERAPHWGAFQPVALTEAVLSLCFACTIVVLVRIHLALVTVALAEMLFVAWFLYRYRVYAHGGRLMRPVRPVLLRIDPQVLRSDEEEEDRNWRERRKARR
jgi:hypothetical protein